MPARPCRATFSSCCLRTTARISANDFAVPLGASFSGDGASRQFPNQNRCREFLAALRVSQNKAFTPVEKLDARTTGIFVRHFSIADFSESEWPVVPITTAFLFFAHSPTIAGVASCELEVNHCVGFGMTVFKSSPRSIAATIFKSQKFFAHEASAFSHAAFRAGDDYFCHKALTRISQINTDSIFSVKIRAIRVCFFSFQNAAAFQRRAQCVPIFWVHRHERQAIFFLDQFHHRQRGFHRRRVRLDEQILEQRIKFLMQPQRSGRFPRQK